MSRKPKAHMPLREKLAAALAQMMVEVDGKLVRAIPHDDAKLMTAEELCSLFEFDHAIYECIGGPTKHWNLTPRFIAEHRQKTNKIDKPAIAKSKRLVEDQEAFRQRLLRKGSLEPIVAETPTKPRAKIQSRGFSKLPKKDWKTGKIKEVSE